MRGDVCPYVQLFHVSLLYNLALQHEQRRPWWSRVEPLLLLGALPLREKQHLTQVRHALLYALLRAITTKH